MGKYFYKFLGGMFSGNTCKKCAGVYKGIPMVYVGGYMYCTNNMFMVLQVVVLWLYMSYKFCVDIYLITKIFFIGGWGGCGLTSTLCICIVKCNKSCILVDDYHISKTPVELPTFLFNGNYRSPSFDFQHQHLS